MILGFNHPVKTQLSPADALDALADAHNSMVGGEPTNVLLAVLATHTALETAFWQSMWNYNFGNIRGTYVGQWTSFKAGEIIDGKEVILDPGPMNKFRAYPDKVEGAKDYISLLNRLYPFAWQSACEGNIRRFTLDLHEGGYFTANPTVYLKAMIGDFNKLISLPEWEVWKNA